jgi:hypothetical protein
LWLVRGIWGASLISPLVYGLSNSNKSHLVLSDSDTSSKYGGTVFLSQVVGYFWNSGFVSPLGLWTLVVQLSNYHCDKMLYKCEAIHQPSTKNQSTLLL